MTENPLEDRGRAMEDLFFHDLDQQLVDKMKAEMAADEDRKSLMAATGIEDAAVIESLMSHNVSPETLAGVGLIPLIAVAWADGKMEDNEREAILKAASETGIDEKHPCFGLVSSWLNKKPASTLFDSWKEYIGALKGTLDDAAVSQIKRSVVDRAKRVADSAGGFLGIGSTSAAEQSVLQEMESVFG